jgi:hypothetical protein
VNRDEMHSFRSLTNCLHSTGEIAKAARMLSKLEALGLPEFNEQVCDSFPPLLMSPVDAATVLRVLWLFLCRRLCCAVLRGVTLRLLLKAVSYQRVSYLVPGVFAFQVTLLRTAVLLPSSDVSGGGGEGGGGGAGPKLPKRAETSEQREEARRKSNSSGKRDSEDAAAASRRTTTGGTSKAEAPPPSPTDAADAADAARGHHANGDEGGGGGGGSGESAEAADDTEPEFLPLAEVTFLQVRMHLRRKKRVKRVSRGVCIGS